MDDQRSADSMEDLLQDDARLPKVPKVLRVDRKGIFALAADDLRLTVQAETTIQIDEDSFITKILIDNILDKESCEFKAREFSGEIARTKKLAVQNAYHAALNYLEMTGMVQIGDYNAPNVKKLEKDVLYFSSWSMLFEDKVAKLKKSIQAKDAALRSFLASFDLACQESSVASGLHVASGTGPSSSKKQRREKTAAAGKPNTASPVCRLSQLLEDLRAQLLSLLADEPSAKATIVAAAVR